MMSIMPMKAWALVTAVVKRRAGTAIVMLFISLAVCAGISTGKIGTMLQSAELDLEYVKTTLPTVAQDSGGGQKIDRIFHRLVLAQANVLVLGDAAWLVAFTLSLGLVFFDRTPRVFRIATLVTVVILYLNFVIFRSLT